MDLDKKISSFIKKYGKRIKYNFLIDYKSVTNTCCILELRKTRNEKV